MRDDCIELRHSRRIRIDCRIVADRLVDEITGHVTIGVGNVVGVLRSDVRPYQVIDQLMRFRRIGGVLWDGQIIEPELRPLIRDRIAEFDAALCFRCPFLRLLDVSRKADYEANLASRKRFEIFR